MRPGRPLAVTLLMDSLGVGGAETVLLRLLSGLDRAAFAPRALCLRSLGELTPRFEEAGVPVEVLPRATGGRATLAARIAARLRSTGTDVMLLTQHRAPLLFGRAAAALSRIPNVVCVHDMEGRSIGVRSLPRWTVETMRMTDALVLLAPAQLRYLEREEGLGSRPWRRTRTAIIPNGVEIGPPVGPEARRIARDRLGLAEEDLVVGMVAALRPDKAHDVLLQAAARLAPAEPRLRVVLVGGGSREPALRAVAAELGVAERVTFAGVRHDVRELLPALDVKALASYPVKETFPMAVLEAMAAARPVVATRCGALEDIVEEGVEGHLVPPADPAALADRIAALLASPGERARMGAAARARAVRDFDVRSTISRYEELIRSLAW